MMDPGDIMVEILTNWIMFAVALIGCAIGAIYWSQREGGK